MRDLRVVHSALDGAQHRPFGRREYVRGWRPAARVAVSRRLTCEHGRRIQGLQPNSSPQQLQSRTVSRPNADYGRPARVATLDAQ